MAPAADAITPPATAREIETKFDVAPDFAVPALDEFAGPDGRVEVDTVRLSSTYHDSPAMDLLRFRITLRRRQGDADTGWQLKVPGSGFRTELHWPVEGDTPPPEMLALLAPFLRGATPRPAIRLDVVRTRHRVLNADGKLVAEIAADDVRAVPLEHEVRARRWHEVEIELGKGGDRAALERMGKALLAAGAFTSTSRSKLGRATRGIGNEGVGTARHSAGAVLLEYIGAQSDALTAGHFAIHQDATEAIHDTRVACRRLRSTLRTFADCFDIDAAIDLEIELKWYADVLGEVRDLEVLRVRLAEAVTELPDDLIVGPVAKQIDARLNAELLDRRGYVLQTLDGERYADLLAAVVHWRDDPPFTAAAGRPASTLAAAVAQAEKRMSRRLHRATEPASTDEQMHRARKAGKRMRYAAEVTEGENAKTVKRIKALQDLLGEFQDSVVATELLRRLAAEAARRGEDGFTYGVLLAEERARADRIREQARVQN